MPQLELVTIPCLSDNYAFLLHNAETGETALVDAPEAAPIRAALAAHDWALTDIFITHHHNDHIGAVEELRWAGIRVIGAAADAHRLPLLDLQVQDGDTITLCGANATVLEASGHTIGHIALHVPDANAVFTADSLMAMGCGRLFEGDADTMWATLTRLSALPPETLVCSGHEYTAANMRFAVTIDPDNAALTARRDRIEAARANGEPTVPSVLSEERATNPFLRAASQAVKAHVGLPHASDAEAFAEVRRRKDAF